MTNARSTILEKYPQLKDAYEAADKSGDRAKYSPAYHFRMLVKELRKFEDIILTLESYKSYFEKQNKELLTLKETLENEKKQAAHSITSLNMQINQLYSQVSRLGTIEAQQKNTIKKLETDLAQQSQKNSELNLKLSSYEKKNENLEKNITELNELNGTKIKELENQLEIEKKSFREQLKNFELKEKNYENSLEQAKVKLNHLEGELFDVSKMLVETLEQLKERDKSSKPLDIQLDETKELNQEILMQLVDPSQNIEGLSLICWSEKNELENIKEDLIERGAILTVSDLLDQIQKIQPPHNEKRKVKLLNHAVEKLMLDYEEHFRITSLRPQEKILPDSVMESLMDPVTREIEQDLKAENPEWLRDMYLTQIDLIKNALFDKYFSKEAEEISCLNEQFKQAIEWIAKSERHKHYHRFLNDQNILNKIRNENNDPTFNLLIKIIKSKMDASQIEITEAHHQKALQTILKEPTEEMNKLIHHKIIQYGEKLKKALDPRVVKIKSLKAEILELQKKLENRTQPSPESPRVTATTGTLFASSLQGQRQEQASCYAGKLLEL